MLADLPTDFAEDPELLKFIKFYFYPFTTRAFTSIAFRP